MKTIKIFLASSEELDYDRMAFGNLVRIAGVPAKVVKEEGEPYHRK